MQEIPARVGLRRNTFQDVSSLEEPQASTSRAASAFPQAQMPTAGVKDYLVGTQLDEAMNSGQDLIISWPFANGDVSDWTQAEAIWYVSGPKKIDTMTYLL